MGICVSYKMAQEKGRVKDTLDRAEKIARGMQQLHEDIDIEIERESDTALFINLGNCETLAFDFKSRKDIEAQEEREGWTYEKATLEDLFKDEDEEHLQKFPEQRLYYSSSFTKTQFAESITEHMLVCDLIKVVAGYCRLTDIMDEGDYYHTGQLGDAQDAIKENGALISSVVDKLEKLGYTEK